MNKTHGMKWSREYNSWYSMKARCCNPERHQFKRYGGRGIKVCKRWMKFENFFKDMGARPIGKTLDRKNSDKNYSKSNCKWSTPKEQARNRSSNKTVFLNGKKRCISEISEITKIHKGTLWNRINRGFKNGDIYAAV